MKKKENKGTGSHGIGNRTVIGIICIVAALLICFGVAPVVNRISDGKVSIVRVIRQVEAGAVIGADDVAVVEDDGLHIFIYLIRMNWLRLWKRNRRRGLVIMYVPGIIIGSFF